jgi:hypothetical protein
MKNFSIITVTIVLASMAGLTGRANAQVFDRNYAKALILAGNGTSNTNTITLLAPTLTGSAFSLTLPAAAPTAVGLALVSSSTTGGLTWSASAPGTVTSVAMTVPGFLSISGSPITTNGTLALSLSGTALPVANGGTGQTSYTNGQLLIGNTTGNTLSLGTLTAGTGISITNGTGTITIANTGSLTNPMTTLGDMIYGSTTGTPATPSRVAGNTTANSEFLVQTGTGSASAAPSWSNTLTDNAIGTGTTTNGLVLTNTTAATSGTTEQYSPALVLSGAAWKSASTAASQTDSWSIQDQPVTGSSITASNLVFSDNTAGTPGVDATLSNLGTLTLGASSSETGALALANSGGANITTIEPASGASTITYILPATPPTEVGQLMSVSNITGNTVTLQWNTSTATPAQLYQQTSSTISTTAIPESGGNNPGMAGISNAGSGSFTPKSTGRVLLTVVGDIYITIGEQASTTSGTIQMYYGTGTAPTNDEKQSSAGGTAFGPPCVLSVTTADHSEEASFTSTAYISGLSVGTTYWVDGNVTVGSSAESVQITNVEITVIELP